jgi:hypothetical protein
MSGEGSDASEDLQFAIEWYVEVIPSSDYLPYRPPRDLVAVDEALATIDVELAPLRLPPEVRWLWRAWDPKGFDVLPYPRLCDPGFALQSWRMDVVEGSFPRALFPIAYESHGFLLLELGGEAGQPAPVWYYAYTDSEFVCAYPSVAALFRSCAEAVEVRGPR